MTLISVHVPSIQDIVCNMKKYKVVYNASFGGFTISYKAYKWLIEHGLDDKYLYRDYNDERIQSRKFVKIIYDKDGRFNYVIDTKEEQHHTDDELNKLCTLYLDNIPRHNKLLVQCVEELGEEASGPGGDLRITTIYSRLYRISDYDGEETVHEIDDEDIYCIDEQ